MRALLAIAAGAAVLAFGAPAAAQEASARYAVCSGADARIAEICGIVDDIHARLGRLRAGAHLQRWGELHYALGMALFAVGSAGDESALRDSVAASRVAAEYFTRERTPTRWAAIQTHIAGALTELGERGDEAALREAVATYHAAIDAIVRAQQPELWASAQYSLGGAYALLARYDGRDALLEAAAALRASLEIYRRPVFAEQRARAEALLADVLAALSDEQSRT